MFCYMDLVNITTLPERLISVTVIMLKTLMFLFSGGEMNLNSRE